ncbi:MAG: sulfatase-like hydrolase/transferase [Polyangiales bacterium]
MATRDHVTLAAIGTVALMSVGWGTLIGLVTHRIARPRWLALVLVLPVPLLQVGELLWAVERAADLWPWVGNASVWIVGLALAGAVAAGTWWVARRLIPDNRFWPAFSAGSVGFLVLILSLFPLQGIAPRLGIGAQVALAAGGVFLLASEWRQGAVAFAGLAACVGALVMIPESYARLYEAFAGAGVGFAVLLAGRPWRRRFGDRRGRWWEHLAWLGAAALCTWSASTLVGQEPSVWRDHPRERSLLGVLVRLGQRATDVDGDGHGTAFGQRDCAPFDAAAFPGAHERPGNDVDENCLAGPAPEGAAERVRRAEAVNPPPAPWDSDGDVILVLVDTLRYDDASEPDLPALSALREHAYSFERAYAPSTFTSMSLMGILAGRLPTGYRLEWVHRFNAHPAEPPAGLGPWLRELGWDTALAGASEEEENAYFREEGYGHGFRVRELGSLHEAAEGTTDRALRAWRKLDPHKRRFMWVHYMWVHEPREREGYREAVRDTDEAIGRLRDELADEDILWVVTSDHGEEFGEHGGKNHAQTLYEEVVHVPLLIDVPGRRGGSVPSVSPLRSLPATLMAMLYPERIPPGRGPYLCLDQPDCGDVPAPMALEMQHVHLHGLVQEHRHVVRDPDRGRLVAFDLRDDPTEQEPLDPVPAELVEELTFWEENALGLRSARAWWPYRDDPF